MSETDELKEAERHLAAANRDLLQAEREVEEAAAEIAAVAKELLHEFTVEVLYDGVKKPLEVRVEQTVGSVLARAIAAFGSPPNPHTLALYNDKGAELSDSLTIKAAGVKPDALLLLRPSAVKGG